MKAGKYMSKALKATWTVEAPVDTTSTFDAEKVISEVLGKEIMEAVDREVITEITIESYRSQGWTEIALDYPHMIDLIELVYKIDHWCKANLQDEYKFIHHDAKAKFLCFFKDKSDASWFTLRWL